MQMEVSPAVRYPDRQVRNAVSASTTNKDYNFQEIKPLFPQSVKNLIPDILVKLLGIQDAQAAYRGEGQAGHGNLRLGENVQLQAYVSDLPMDYDIAANHEREKQIERRCKHINIGTPKEAKVCVGFNNQLPEEGDHDFILVDNKWYKLRTGDVHISRKEDGTHHIEPIGLDIVPDQFSIFRLGEVVSDPKKVPTVIHQADDPESIGNELAHILNNKPKREPVDYLHRLHNEEGIGPLPTVPPTWEQIIENELRREQKQNEGNQEKYDKNRSVIMP